MNRLTCVVVDDEPIARKGIRSFVERLDYLDFIGFAKDIDELIQILKTTTIDLLFLDIEMPGLSGMEFAQTYEEKLPMIIFVTAYHEYAVESYNVHAVDYLLKPVSFDRFKLSAERALEIASSKSPDSSSRDSFFLRHDGKFLRVNYREIVYLSAMQNYVRIHLMNHKQLVVRYTMKTIMEFLDPDRFLTVHKSYIVHKDHVEAVSSGYLSMAGYGQIPIGRTFKDDVLPKLIKS